MYGCMWGSWLVRMSPIIFTGIRSPDIFFLTLRALPGNARDDGKCSLVWTYILNQWKESHRTTLYCIVKIWASFWVNTMKLFCFMDCNLQNFIVSLFKGWNKLIFFSYISVAVQHQINTGVLKTENRSSLFVKTSCLLSNAKLGCLSQSDFIF